MKILLLTAPMVQINTPYPATAYLKGFLDERFPAGEIQAVQDDPALLLILRLFTPAGLETLRRAIGRKPGAPELLFFLDAFADYTKHIGTAIAYLQGKAPAAERKLARRDLLPEGPRFAPLHEGGPYLAQFEALSRPDKAQHVASLFLDDIADFFRFADPRFQFSRYGEKLAASRPSFDPMLAELNAKPTIVDEALDALTNELLDRHRPAVLGLSVPFAGTVYAALRMGRIARARGLPVLLGGGYVNTELRSLGDPRIFDFVDFIPLDDGERPLLTILEHLQGARSKQEIFRTYYYAEDGKVARGAGRPGEKDIPFRESGTPSYAGLPLGEYISMYEMLNPVTKLWSGYFWNKLTLAHGCYWHRCSFCDTKLDYIGRYEAEKASRLVDRMEKIAAETGRRGFHFVDEAAPPALLRSLSEEILKRGLQYEWWGNIRFDKAFNAELTRLMQRAGCIAVTGGLEVASPRILKLIDKGVTVEQVARVTRAFRAAGIFVHAYLMYGFPSQTEQETVDSLEIVRQLFQEGCLQSAFWHRFAATVHSPVGHDPAAFAIRLLPVPPADRSAHGNFSQNDLLFQDPAGVDHESLGEGLRAALYNYMHGVGLEGDVRQWFPRPVPKPRIPATFIAEAL